jgi:subtilisin family serine protease
VCILSTFPLEQGEYGTISGTSMASPHAAGALALLASSNNPNNATDVFNLYNQVINAGNFDWTDDSGDGIQEPLLDVSTFTPTLIPGGGGGGGDGVSLSVTTYKVKGNKYADLSWSGATSTDVDIYRDGGLIATTANDGEYTDGPLGKGGGSASYQVCEAGTATCSDVVNVSW